MKKIHFSDICTCIVIIMTALDVENIKFIVRIDFVYAAGLACRKLRSIVIVYSKLK